MFHQQICKECPTRSQCIRRLTRSPEALDTPEPELDVLSIKKKDAHTLTQILKENVVTVRQGAFKVTDEGGDVLFLTGEGALFGPELHLPRLKIDFQARPLMPEIGICITPWTTFRQMMNARPALMENVLVEMANNALTSRLAFQWTKKSLRDRAILLLAMLRDRFGVRYGQFKMINVPLTKIDIASMMSTVQESAVRVLSELRENGLISQNGKRIIILDNDRLDRLNWEIRESNRAASVPQVESEPLAKEP